MRLPHRLQGQKVKSQGGAGAYCGGDLAAQLVILKIEISPRQLLETPISKPWKRSKIWGKRHPRYQKAGYGPEDVISTGVMWLISQESYSSSAGTWRRGLQTSEWTFQKIFVINYSMLATWQCFGWRWQHCYTQRSSATWRPFSSRCTRRPANTTRCYRTYASSWRQPDRTSIGWTWSTMTRRAETETHGHEVVWGRRSRVEKKMKKRENASSWSCMTCRRGSANVSWTMSSRLGPSPSRSSYFVHQANYLKSWVQNPGSLSAVCKGLDLPCQRTWDLATFPVTFSRAWSSTSTTSRAGYKAVILYLAVWRTANYQRADVSLVDVRVVLGHHQRTWHAEGKYSHPHHP